MRGMGMREMKARQKAGALDGERAAPREPELPAPSAPVRKKPGPKPKAASGELPPADGDDEAELEEEPLDAGALVDQGDGVRVSRGRRRTQDDDRCHDLPDEPPPGWLEG